MGNESVVETVNALAAMPSSRELSFGEKACGVSFNPGGLEIVTKIKKDFADLVDKLNNLRLTEASPEVKRMLSLAITDAQTSQMWAVKAVTWQH